MEEANRGRTRPHKTLVSVNSGIYWPATPPHSGAQPPISNHTHIQPRSTRPHNWTTVSANDNDSDSGKKWRFGAHPFFWWWMNLAYSQYGFGEVDTTFDSDNI